MSLIPKIDSNPKKHSGIVYPHVSTWMIFKEYLKLLRPYWVVVVLVVIGMIIASLSEAVIVPVFYKRFFDYLDVVSNAAVRDTAPLISIIVMILGLNLIKWLGWRLSWILTAYLEAEVMTKGLQKSFDYLIEHSHSFFANNFTGSLTQRIGRFSRGFITIFDRIVFDLFPLVLKITGAGLVLYFAQPVIAYAVGVWIVLFLGVSFVFTRFRLKYDVEAAATHSKISGMLSDAIANHAAIQSFSGYKVESEKIRKIGAYFRHLNIFRWTYSQILNGVQSLLSLAIEFFIFYYGIKYWGMGVISLGTFVLAQAYIVSIGSSLWNFSRIVRDLYEAVADAKEMVEILHLKHEIQDVSGSKELQVKAGVIEFKNVDFRFKTGEEEGKKVFDGISLSIKQGEKVALIGSSGAGKSTLVKLLLRLHDIQGGEILIDSQNIKEVTQESLRNNISLVPQDPALFHRTLMDNIRYGRRDATDEEVITAAKLAHCDEFINGFPQKYETFVGERGVKLSGGERQRVAIARAILKNAPILILDEATSSLDSHSEAMIQDALHTLMKGKTTIVIAHRLSTIRSMDRIIVVSKGGVVEEGSHDDLIKKEGGIYAKLWKLQAGGFENKSIEELLEV